MVQNTVHNDLTFTGRRYDAASNTYDFRARQLDPTLGRFLQADPRTVASFEMARTALSATLAGLADSLTDMLKRPATQNPYAYALNNPLTFNDPSGEGACDETCPFDGYWYGEVSGKVAELIGLASAAWGIAFAVIFFIVGIIYGMFSLICTLDAIHNSKMSGLEKFAHAMINIMFFVLSFVLGIVALVGMATGGLGIFLIFFGMFSLLYSLWLSVYIALIAGDVPSMHCLILPD